MNQCTYMLSDDRRCSNPSVPGTDYCTVHQLYAGMSAGNAGGGALAHFRQSSAVTARPSSIGTEPTYPGLFVDQRHILVGHEGLITLCSPEAGGDEVVDPRLLSLLTTISEEVPLAGRVTVMRLLHRRGYLVRVSTPDREWSGFSRFFDWLAAAAAHSNGRLYVGQEQHFICYRDRQAPRGYDTVAGPVALETLMLADETGQYHIPARELAPLPLDELLLHCVPVADSQPVALGESFVLAPQAYYRLLARYCRRHRLAYRLARFTDQQGARQVVFHLEDGRQEDETKILPANVIAYLSSLPFCQVLRLAAGGGSRKLLVPWNQALPGNAEHLLGVFPADCLVIVPGGQEAASRCIVPAPPFFAGDDLLVRGLSAAVTDAALPITAQDLQLEIPLLLVPDLGTHHSPAAIVLDAEEMAWVRRLLYRLPPMVFDDLRLFYGVDHGVLLGDGRSLVAVPFGIPLRRVRESNLYIPLAEKLVPELSWSVLAEVLDLKDQVVTLLTGAQCFEVPEDAFFPLSRFLVADIGRPSVRLALRPAAALPPLTWTMPPGEGPVPKVDEETLVQQELLAGQSALSTERQPEETAGVPAGGEDREKEIFGLRAEKLLREGDYLSAAVCFSLADDLSQAALCYQQAALALEARTDGDEDCKL
ncbi:MAG: hypothetical protein JXO49_12560 [Deltaproteobacteria bacterium]|nr:hypothetical protein [Candidatus Anaeroferrophillus wilburensis]MBN2890160.1 hypothetical protein [Deltaproteobacteria bacterium]